MEEEEEKKREVVSEENIKEKKFTHVALNSLTKWWSSLNQNLVTP